MLIEHLKLMADHSIHTLHGQDQEEKGHFFNHELVEKGNHETIMKFLEHFATSHPHVAKHMAKKLLKICNSVLEQPGLAEHHENSSQLHSLIKEFHNRIQCSYEKGHTFNEYGHFIGGDLAMEDSERINDQLSALALLQSTEQFKVQSILNQPKTQPQFQTENFDSFFTHDQTSTATLH